MTVMTLPKKLQKNLRHDRVHSETAPAGKAALVKVNAEISQAAAAQSDDVEEKCPVIRASRIVFSASRTGRTRVVFF